MNKNPYKHEVVSSLTPKIITEWKTLWTQAQNANPFNSYEWFQSCQHSFQADEYEIHLCYKNSVLAGVLPLKKDKKFGISVLGNFGDHHLIDTPFLLKSYDKELFSNFIMKILTTRHVFLHKIDSEAAQILRELSDDIFLSLMSVNPYIRIYENPHENIAKSTMSKIKSILRKNAGSFELRSYFGWDKTSKQMNTIFKIDAESSKERNARNIFSKDDMRKFFRAISKYESGTVQLNVLYYNGVSILYEYGFLYKDIYSGYITAYKYQYRKLNPGKIMIYLLLDYLKTKRVLLLDMGGGISNYKMEFAREYRLLYDLYYSPNENILFWWKGINKLRRLKQIILPEKNTRDHDFLFRELENNNPIALSVQGNLVA